LTQVTNLGRTIENNSPILIYKLINMATFRISGVWKDSNNIITHYAVHTVNADGGLMRATKKRKHKLLSYWKQVETVQLLGCGITKQLVGQ
jgi:hypothetical protein